MEVAELKNAYLKNGVAQQGNAAPKPVTVHYTSKGVGYVDPAVLVERADVKETYEKGREIVRKKIRSEAR